MQVFSARVILLQQILGFFFWWGIPAEKNTDWIKTEAFSKILSIYLLILSDGCCHFFCWQLTWKEIIFLIIGIRKHRSIGTGQRRYNSKHYQSLSRVVSSPPRQYNSASKLSFSWIPFVKFGIGKNIVSPGTACVWCYKATLSSTVFG